VKEQQHYNFLPISNQTIVDSLVGKSDEQIKELGVNGTLIFMIRRGFATQLREDVFNKLSQALNLDISPHLSTPDEHISSFKAEDVDEGTRVE